MVYETRIERVSVKVHFVEGRNYEIAGPESRDDRRTVNCEPALLS